MRIQTNINAMNTYRNLTLTNRSLSQSLERLSSGFRINRAADDAAGLAISEKMRGQIRALNRSVHNAQDGINLIQTAERAMIEVHNNLQRMRELAVQGANDTLTANDRQEMQKEVDQLLTEIDRIGNTTEFNTKKLLDGSSAALASSDRLETKIFIRDGLRVEDQFGQKMVGGGNYRLDIVANPGTGQIQKTDIFKVKHGDSVMEVQDNEPGHAKAFIFDFFNVAMGDTVTMEFVIDGEQYQVVYTAEAAGEGTDVVAAAINSQLGHLVSAYGQDEQGDVEWRSAFLTTDHLILVLDGGAVNDKTEFDFWVSDVTGMIGLGPGVPQTRTTYKAEDSFIHSVEVNDASKMILGDYTIDLDRLDPFDSVREADVFTQFIQRSGVDTLFGVDLTAAFGQDLNISLLLEVEGIDTEPAIDVITMRYRYHVTDAFTGEVVASSEGLRDLTVGNTNDGIVFGGFAFTEFDLAADSTDFSVGDRMLINAQSVAGSSPTYNAVINRDGNATVDYSYNLLLDMTQPLTLSFYQLNESTGEFNDSEVTINFNDDAWTNVPLGLFLWDESLSNAAYFSIAESSGIGQLASLNTKLYDIDRFWDASGNFLLEDSQTITLIQGDGTKAAFTIFRDDTIQDVVDKMDAAIRNPKTNFYPGTIEAGKGLGQGAYVDDPNARFAYYVEEVGNPGPYGTYDTVEGTIVINSAIAGKYGEIRFIGDEDIIKALSLTTIRESEENRFAVDVYNAHSDKVAAENIIITSNLLVGVVHTNVDVEFDPSANITVGWQNAITGQQKEEYTHPPNAFYFESQYVTKGEKYQTFIHLADNTLVYHIGANPMQNVGAAIGDMRTRALGVHNVVVTDREAANDAIVRLDAAIDRVSSERSRLGALQNRLDHTILNLAVASENLSAAESRIRDVDMAFQMMEFTKQQILAQAGTAMLAQANMNPQLVLQLLGS